MLSPQQTPAELEGEPDYLHPDQTRGPQRTPPATASLAAIQWVGFRTIVIREYGRIVRIWGQTLVPSAVTATLYFIIFGSLIGQRIGTMDGFNYLQYIGPGQIIMAIITNSFGNVVSSFFGAKFGKHVEELLVSPLPNWIIVCGYTVGGLVRGALVGLVVTAVALIFARLPVDHPIAIVSAALLTSAAFSLAGFINAVFARNFEQMNIVQTFILSPLTYLGGVFYTVSMLPHWAQRISFVNPILYMVNAFRYGFLGVSDVPVVSAFAFMIVLVLVLFGVAVLLLHRGVGTRE